MIRMTHPLYVPTLDSRGVTHPSIRACARAHGRASHTVAYHLDTHGDLSRLGTGKSRPGCQNAAKALRLGRHEFPSRVAAAKALRISVPQLYRWTHPTATPVMRDMLMAALMAYDQRASK